MSARAVGAQPGTAPRRGVRLGSRLRATALSEWIKFRSVRSVPLILIATALTVVAGAWLLGAGHRGSYAALPPGSKAAYDPVYTVLQGIELAQLFIGALGVLTVTGEYSSGLIRITFVATPQRGQVLAMKLLVFTSAVWACCTALSFAAFFAGQAALAPARHAAISDPGVLTAVIGGGLYLTLIGLLGIFTGVLVRHTPAALAALFGLLLVLPLVVTQIPGRVSRNLGEYLPDAGQHAWHLRNGGPYSLGHWQGLGVLAGYVAVAGSAAFALIMRRDA